MKYNRYKLSVEFYKIQACNVCRQLSVSQVFKIKGNSKNLNVNEQLVRLSLSKPYQT